MEKFIAICLLLISLTASCQEATNNITRNWEVRMTEKDEPGKKFTLDITVLDIATKQPIKDAEIFAYHTNHKGDYVNDANGIAKIHGTAWSNEKGAIRLRSEEHTSELQSQSNLVCRLLLEKKK